MLGASFLTDKERLELRAVLRRVRGDALALRRANIVLLLDKGWTFEQVAEAFFLERSTIEAVQRSYKTGGISSLHAADILGRPLKLTVAQRAELALHLSNAIMPRPRKCAIILARHMGLLIAVKGLSPS